MANELKHGSVGTELTQAEWEGVGAHVFNSQATGDIVYASSSSQLSRLAKGTDTHVLILSSGIPAWSTSTGITAVGTIATGTWQGTDVGVAYGGTGVSTLTDGGILLGSGANAITAMAVLTDGQMIVGDGTTDPVAESGATLRTSIGVGTGDSPTFTGLTLSGDLAVNGTDITSTGALNISPVGVLTLDIRAQNAAFRIDNAGGVKLLEIDSRTTADNILVMMTHPPVTDSAAQYTNHPTLELAASTLTLTGSTGVDSLDAGLVVRQLTVTDTSSLTIAQAHTVYIAGAPIAAGSVTITEPLALFVDAGTSRFDGNINMNDSDLLNVGASGSDWDTTSLRNAGDYFGINGKGMVIGHTAFTTAGTQTSELQVLGTSYGDSSITLGRWSADVPGPSIYMTKSRNGTVGGNTIVVDDDDLGSIVWFSNDGTNADGNSAQIVAQVDGTPGVNDVPGRLVFKTTADGATNATERMRITSSGNVGIGTDNPGLILSIHESNTNTTALAGGGPGIKLLNSSDTDGNIASIDFHNASEYITAKFGAQFADAGDRNTDLFFATRANSGVLTERMRIKSTGEIDLQSNALGLTNVGASGNDWSANTLNHHTTDYSGNQSIDIRNTKTSDLAASATLVLLTGGSGGGDPYTHMVVTGGQQIAFGLDASVGDRLCWSNGSSPGSNDRMRLVATTGVLSVDGDGGGSDDPVSLFDELDDAMEIRRFQLSIPQAPISLVERQANRNRMVEIGVGEWAVQEDGSKRYMDRVQPLSRFLAGGIYQNRERMDAQNEAMDERLKRIEQALGV